MKKIVFLRGLPCEEKKEWLDLFRSYTLSLDDFVTKISSPRQVIGGSFRIDRNDESAFDLLYRVLEKRMRNGELVFLDTDLFASEGSFSVYRSISDSFGYEMVCKEFSTDPSESFEFQAQVPECLRYTKEELESHSFEPIPDWVRKIDSFSDIVDEVYLDIEESRFNEVVAFVDVQSHEARQDVLNVFCGNVLNDLQFVLDHIDDDNFIFIEDTHGARLHDIAKGRLHRLNQNDRDSLDEILKGRKQDEVFSEVGRLAKKLKPAFYVDFGGHGSVLFSHGGIASPISPRQIPLLNDEMFTCGVGNIDAPIDEIWEENVGEMKFWQVHGRRHLHTCGKSICLSDVSEGDSLSAVRMRIVDGELKIENL